MKKLITLLLIVVVAGCKTKKEEPEPIYALEYVGEYWTNTADGGNSTAQTWVITSENNKLYIEYTIKYTFRNQGKEIRSTDVYLLKDIPVNNPKSFKIDQVAELTEDGVKKTRHILAEAVKGTKPDGKEFIGTTIKFTDPATNNSLSTDYLEFKRK
jgi:hypothetical protein